METTTKRKRRTTRRGNGEGSIYERPDGRWSATITVGYSETGKRIRRTVYARTKGGVMEKLAELNHDKLKGTLTEPSQATVAEFLREWLDSYAKPEIRHTTYKNYRNSVENHVIPAIGGIRLVKLTAMHVQRLYASMQARGLKPTTIRSAHIVIGLALAKAVAWRYINRDPSRDASPPALDHREMQVLDSQQARQLLEAAKDDRMYALYLMALSTGMRLSELTGLQWQDIDFDKRRVSVVRTVAHAPQLIVDAPKTKGSRRTLNVSGSVIDALNDRRRLALAEGLAACPWVFPSRSGNPFRRANLHRHSFKPLLRAAGLPDIRFHDMRHTCASLLLQQGVSVKVVQELLGHANIGITLGTYGHVMPGMHQEATDRMESLLSGATGSQLAVRIG